MSETFPDDGTTDPGDDWIPDPDDVFDEDDVPPGEGDDFEEDYVPPEITASSTHGVVRCRIVAGGSMLGESSEDAYAGRAPMANIVLTFTPEVGGVVADSVADAVMLPEPISIITDEMGRADIRLWATDLASSNKQGWTWRLDIRKAGVTRPYATVRGLHVAANTVQWLADITPMETSTGVYVTKGVDGKTAYEYAVASGFTGTEEEFAANLAAAGSDAANALAIATTSEMIAQNALNVAEGIGGSIGDRLDVAEAEIDIKADKSELASLAPMDSEGNLAPIVLDRLDERYPNSAQTGERLTVVEESTAQRVHVSDTYVGVTQQVGDTVRDKLHAALAEASASGGVVMLPDHPIDVGTGLKLAGYSCGIVGRGGIQDSVKGVETPTSSAIVASQQAGPVMDFDGFNWPAPYRGRLRFADFVVSGARKPDPTGLNHGIYVRPGQGGTGYAGGGAVVWDNIAVSNCAGNALDLTRTYFHNWTNIVLVPGLPTNGINPRVLHGQNVGGCNFDLFVYGGVGGTDKVTRTDGLLWVGDDPTTGATFHSAFSSYKLMYERFHLGANATLFAHQGHNDKITMDWYDVLAVAGAETTTSYLRLEPSQVHFTSAGGNIVTGNIPGDQNGVAGTVGNGIIVSQRGNQIEGTRSYLGRNVVLRPGASDTFVRLSKTYLPLAADNLGIIDETNGATGNTLLDYARYPKDGRNPDAGVKKADETRTPAIPATLDFDLKVRMEPNATYRVRAEVDITTGSDSAVMRPYLVAGTTYSLRYTIVDPTTGAATTKQINGNDYFNPGPSAARRTVVIEGTIRTGAIGAVHQLQWRVLGLGETPFTVHAGSYITAERIA